MSKIHRAPLIDRRIRKTKSTLLKSLAEILTEKKLAVITVRELSERADINRSTFYIHYKDIDNMITVTEDSLFEELKAIISASPKRLSGDDLFPLFCSLFSLAYQDSGLLCALLLENGDCVFLERVRAFFNVQFSAGWFGNFIHCENPLFFDHYFNVFFAGALGLLSSWFNDSMSILPEELAEFCCSLFIKE